MQLGQFLATHLRALWIQFPSDEEHWYPVAVARARIPPAHLVADVLITKLPGLDTGSLWIDELAMGYRWALARDQADPFRPQPWPFPPLEQRVEGSQDQWEAASHRDGALD